MNLNNPKSPKKIKDFKYYFLLIEMQRLIDIILKKNLILSRINVIYVYRTLITSLFRVKLIKSCSENFNYLFLNYPSS